MEHAKTALDYGRNNNLAVAACIIAYKELGNEAKAEKLIENQLAKDKLDHTVRYLANKEDFYEMMDSNPVQTCLDIAFDFDSMGRYEDIITLLSGLLEKIGSITKFVGFRISNVDLPAHVY